MGKKLSIKETASSLGVSHDTIRRRIKSGQIKAVKVETPYGKAWHIDSDDLAQSQEVVEVVTVKQEMTSDDLEGLFRNLLQEQTNEIRGLREEVEKLRDDLRDQKLIEQAKRGKWWQIWKE